MFDIDIYIREYGTKQKPKAIRQITTSEWLVEASELQLLITEHVNEYSVVVRATRGQLHRDVYLNGTKVLDNVPDGTKTGYLPKASNKPKIIQQKPASEPLPMPVRSPKPFKAEALSALVITRDAAPRIGMILNQLKAINPDEIICVVNSKTNDETAEIAKSIATKVELLDFKNQQVIEPILNDAHKMCSSDWILRIDDDELLGYGFLGIKDRLSGIEPNGLFIPRYNCVTGTKKFINTDPWYPDWQLRLYRKKALIPHPGHTHVPIRLEGDTVKFDGCHIIHLLYQWRTYSNRLRRTKYYDYSRYPELKLRELQIFEDYPDQWKGNISNCRELPIIPYEGFDFRLVQIQTTSACPARCTICGYKDGSWMLENKGRMSDDLFTKILQNLNDLDPLFDGKWCPYLMNDPFADPQLVSRVEEAFNALYKPYVEVSTNAALLNRRKIDRLVDVYEENDFNGVIIISHFGIDKESFESSMSLKYERCLKNMVDLVKAFDGRMAIRINNFGVSCDDKLTLFSQQQIDRYMADIIKEHSLPTNNLLVPHVRFHNRAGNAKLDGWSCNRIVREIDNTHPFDCFRIRNNLHVLWNGDVILCCMDYKHEECFGNLTDRRIEDVFGSPEWLSLKDRVTGKRNSTPDFLCKRCLSPGG